MAHLICTGRLGKDAEVKTLQSGTKVAQFSIADDVGWGDKKRTQWIQCSMFGDRAVKIAQHLTKGSLVEIYGTPEVDSWLKDGRPNAAIKVSVSDVRFVPERKGDDRPVADITRAASGDDMNQDIPF